MSRLITFKQLNLMHESLQRPGDLLFIGHSESMFKVSDAYSLIGRTIYQRNEVQV